jgi:hypothetical protein
VSDRKPADRRTGAASRRTKGGRTTPKAERPADRGRYTPPVPKSQKVSPPWVPVLMFTLLVAGVLVIVLNYLNLIGDASNGKLLIGLALITGGFITATNYH